MSVGQLGFAAGIIAGLAVSAPSAAQQSPAPQQNQQQAQPSASHLAAARELIQITGALTTVDEMLPTFGEQIKRQSVTRPELAKDLDAVLKALEPELGLQRQQIVNRAALSYAKFMTEGEIKEVTAFFKTPSGAKYTKVQGDLIEELVTNVQAWTQDVSEYVMVRTRAEMLKRGHQMQ